MDQTISKTDIQELIQGFSIEITPKGALNIRDFRHLIPAETAIYVTHLSGAHFDDTIRTCAELKAQGLSPVPHFALRNFADELELRHGLDDIQRLEINKMLLLAGSLSQPRGNYDNVPDFLKSEIVERYHFQSIGFAGHPEGAPHIPAAEIAKAEALKQGYALTYPRDYYFMTQFCFATAPIFQWLDSLQKRDIHLPICVGIPGVASLKSLIHHAKNCGIGASMDFLWKNTGSIQQLMRLRKPNTLLFDLATFKKNHPDCQLRSLHFYPLGGFQQTILYLQNIMMGQFVITENSIEVYES